MAGPTRESPSVAAARAAHQAGVVTCPLVDLEDLAQVEPLMNKVWGATGSQVAMPVNLLRALVHSGSYVAGAWRGGQLVGAAVAFLGQHDSVLELHSHVLGVTKGTQGGGVGYALKLHQRAWADDRSIQRITWTYDPLMRKNGWLNLVKLGARAEAYYPNFYGVMLDDLNGDDETDRCLVGWDLTRPWPPPPPRAAGPDTAVLLTASATHAPVVTDAAPLGRASEVMCQIPEDVVAIRRRDSGLAREWRLAVRATMGRAMQAGFSAVSISKDGWYLLEKAPPW